MYAEGFAWAAYGVADEVLTKVNAMLPQSLVAKLPAAQQAFAKRYAHVSGNVTIGATWTVGAGVSDVGARRLSRTLCA